MKAITILSIFSLGSTCLAAPSANATALDLDLDLEKRQQGGVDLCTEINWSGTCGYKKQPFDLCIKLTSPYYHTISSIGPDKQNALVFSSDQNCNDNAYTMFYPGSADLRNQGWNDAIGSFRVRQIPGEKCIANVDQQRLPGVNCQSCCNGCDLSGTDCCPQGQAGCGFGR